MTAYEIIDGDQRITINLRLVTHVSMEVEEDGATALLRVYFSGGETCSLGGPTAAGHYTDIARAMNKVNE